jgi:hypothetical protein
VTRTECFDGAKARARELGAEDGLAAASWVFDGNTSDDAYRRILAGITDGDPEILDLLPYPDLSGQWVDVTSSRQLLTEIAADAGPIADDDADAILNAYEDAYVTAAHHEVERVARYMLAE